jgi:hypothetical protein
LRSTPFQQKANAHALVFFTLENSCLLSNPSGPLRGKQVTPWHKAFILNELRILEESRITGASNILAQNLRV